MREDQILNFEREIDSSILLDPNLTVFKIFGEEYFQFEKAQYQSKVDWSGFYTQLSQEHSMRYLTKKWDDGAQMSCLIKLIAKEPPLKLLTVTHEQLGNAKISGEVKSFNIKKHLACKYPQFKEILHHKLLSYLGQHHTLMACVDSQDLQIIIPHQLLNSNYFQFEHIASFQRSNDGMLRTISFRRHQQWVKVPPSVQFEPYLLLKQKIWLD